MMSESDTGAMIATCSGGELVNSWFFGFISVGV